MLWRTSRAETLPARHVYPGTLSLRSRILIFFHVFIFFFSLCFFWTAQIAPVSCPFSLSSCRISVFSVLTFHMYETKKNKKALQQFLKSLIFPPYPLHVIFPYALYMADFLFYRSQVERKTFCSSFSSLNSYMSRFLRHSKKHKKTRKFRKPLFSVIFGRSLKEK